MLEVVPCDFFLTVTAPFRILIYIFVALDCLEGLVHFEMPPYPTGRVDLQQLREALPAMAIASFSFIIGIRLSRLAAIRWRIEHLRPEPSHAIVIVRRP